MSKNIPLKKYTKGNSGYFPVEGCFPFPFSVFSVITTMSTYHLDNWGEKKVSLHSRDRRKFILPHYVVNYKSHYTIQFGPI